MTDTREHLSPLTIGLHWIVGLSMIGMAVFGIWLADLPRGEFKSQMIALHKSLGVVVLAVAAWRLARRIRIGFPPDAGTSPAWQMTSAKAVHGLLLATTILIPLSGIAFTLTSARPLVVFGVEIVPTLLAARDVASTKFLSGAHAVTGKALLVLAVFHVAAALKHHWIDKDSTLTRMLGAGEVPTDVA